MELTDLSLFDDIRAATALADELSVLRTGEPLIVRVADGGLTAGDSARAALRALPTVSVLVTPDGDVEPSITALFDVCVTDRGDPPAPWVEAPVGAVIDAVAAQPLAALSLVTLLRDPRPTVWAGLAAESATYGLLLGSGAFSRWQASTARAAPSPDDDSLAVDRRGPSQLVTFRRPECHNALDSTLRDQFVQAFDHFAGDPSIARIAIWGDGPSFCSGGDLREFGLSDPAVAHGVRLTRHPAAAIARCPHPVGAFVHGACIGAGTELAAMCHLVVADPSARFSLPELQFGLIPGAGGTVSLPRRVGRSRSAFLALTGTVLDAATALRWGLVDELVHDLGAALDDWLSGRDTRS